MNKLLALPLVCLGLSGCFLTDGSISTVTDTQQRNSHIHLANEYMQNIVSYESLITCSDAVTTKCKNVDYINNTVIPAKKNYVQAQTNYNSAIANGTVTSDIRDSEAKTFGSLKDVATGSTIQNAIAK
jgi:hypothetical protein